MDKVMYIVYGLLAILTFYQIRYYLHMLQQNSYRNERFTRWLKNYFPSRKRNAEVVLIILAVALMFFFLQIPAIIVNVFLILILLVAIFYKKEKKPLVFTDRAKRIFGVALLLGIAYYAVVFLFVKKEYLRLLLLNLGYLFSFLFVFGSNIILVPVQANINNWYYNDAKKILQGMPNLTIIGITGSYGKTSTKHYLHRILSEKYNVLMTPGSYNTLMGVIITIRRDLKPYHNVFIVEMGAKQNGDIKEICDLVNPKYGILTAVGGQHLETFKSIENVQKTKFELVDALPSDGLAILNSDFPYVANRSVTNVAYQYYGLKGDDVAITAKDISYDHEGMQFNVFEKGKELVSLQTKILGDYNVSNLLACVLMAKKLGVEYSDMHYGAKRIQPVKHRLEMKKSPNNVTILDDAFNSNPLGAKMALDVMGRFEGGKKIIITPGMVELGTCLLYTSPSPRDQRGSRMPSSA